MGWAQHRPINKWADTGPNWLGRTLPNRSFFLYFRDGLDPAQPTRLGQDKSSPKQLGIA